MRAPFDSAVELDDLLQGDSSLCPEVWTARERCNSRGRGAVSSADQDEPESRSHMKPSRSAAHPVPRRPDNPRPRDCGASAGLVPRAGVRGLPHRPRRPDHEWLNGSSSVGIMRSPSFPRIDGLVEHNRASATTMISSRTVASPTGTSADALLSELERAALGTPRRQAHDDVAMLMLNVPLTEEGSAIDPSHPEPTVARS